MLLPILSKTEQHEGDDERIVSVDRRRGAKVVGGVRSMRRGEEWGIEGGRVENTEGRKEAAR